MTVQAVPRGVVGRAEKNQFGIFIGGSQQFTGTKLEVVVEQHLPVGHVVDIGTYLVHAISRLDGHHIVHSRTAERPERQVDGLVASVPQENLFGLHLLLLGNQVLQVPLQGVRITVVRNIIRVFIGVQEHRSLFPLIFITGRRIRLQFPDIRPDQFF